MSPLLVRALHHTIYGDGRTKYGVIQVLTVLSQGCTLKIQAWDGMVMAADSHLMALYGSILPERFTQDIVYRYTNKVDGIEGT